MYFKFLNVLQLLLLSDTLERRPTLCPGSPNLKSNIVSLCQLVDWNNGSDMPDLELVQEFNCSIPFSSLVCSQSVIFLSNVSLRAALLSAGTKYL